MRGRGRVYTAAEVRELDRIAIEDRGIPGIALMKRAGRAVFDEVRRRWPAGRSLTVVCGSGNNAGDGYIVAGLAVEAGLDTRLLQVGDGGRFRGDAALARDWALSVGVVTSSLGDGEDDKDGEDMAGDVVVDALLGTGASGPLRPAYAAAVERINACRRPVVAVDLPSGVSADTGALLGAAVRADTTVTFIGRKLGLFTGDGVDHAGEVVFDSLGVPEDIYESVRGVRVLVAPRPPDRPRSAHKNRFGHVLVIGGDRGMGGAPLLTAEAALRTGAGLVSMLTRPEHCAGTLARRPEVMVRGVSEGDGIEDLLGACTVIAVGPGLGRSSWGRALLTEALVAGKPLVIDADALNLIAEGGCDVPAASVMTPHPGEASRLLGGGRVTDRPAAVRELSRRFGNVVLLKGAGTLVAVAGEVRGVCIDGNPGLATAGSGDVLTGVVAGLAAQGFALAEAAEAGVCLHATAGDTARQRLAPRPLVASDVVDHLWRGTPDAS